jgi:hypothetical protein
MALLPPDMAWLIAGAALIAPPDIAALMAGALIAWLIAGAALIAPPPLPPPPLLLMFIAIGLVLF